MAKEFHQGKFTPKNPEKYVGDVNNIIYRSSWEKRLLLWLDENPSVLKYSSEEIVIPYLSPVDNRIHRYFPDFLVEFKDINGVVKKVLIEIKPKAQTVLPTVPKRLTESYHKSVETYAINQAKWTAAKAWCKNHNMDFWIMTEYELGLKK